MRGISTNGQYTKGFVSGVLFVGVLLGGARVIKWAASTDVVAAVVTWATTPSISPVGLVVNAVPILFILLILIAISSYMAVGPRRI
jgi:hypothetical protein